MSGFSASQSNGLNPGSILQLLRKHFLLLAVPTIAFCALSIAYSTLGPKKYGARQTLLVRDQLIGGNYVKPGRFESTYSLKSAQEAISEIAKNPTVIRKALANAKLSKKPAGEPDDKTIENYQGSISVSSPNGSEFGKSEMIDLVVKAGSRDDALAWVQSLTTEIENQMRSIRQKQAESMVQELSETVRLAEKDHKVATSELQKMESRVGADLAELRSLNNPYTASGSIQSQLNNVKTETRSAINDLENLKKQQALLQQAALSPDSLTATPDEALTLLPALKNFKEGLVKAQLELSKNRGQYSDQHPKVIASLTEVGEIKLNIAKELKSSITAKEKQIEIAEQKVNRLRNTGDGLSKRLERLALLRVEYDRLFNIVQQRNDSLTKATHELNQMKSLREAAGKVNFVTRVDEAQVGTSPLGLNKKLTVGIGTMFGLFLGLGLVMFVAGGPAIAEPPPVNGTDPFDSASSNRQPNDSSNPSQSENAIRSLFEPPVARRQQETDERPSLRSLVKTQDDAQSSENITQETTNESLPLASSVPPAMDAFELSNQADEEFDEAESAQDSYELELDADLDEDSDTLLEDTSEFDEFDDDEILDLADDLGEIESDDDDDVIAHDRRKRERTASRNETRTNPSPQFETPSWDKSAFQPPAELPTEFSPAAAPIQFDADTPELVIPEADTQTESDFGQIESYSFEDAEMDSLLADADEPAGTEDFQPPELEGINLESRGSLNDLCEMNESQSVDSTPDAATNNLISFDAQDPQAIPGFDSGSTPQDTSPETENPIRLTPRQTTDPIREAQEDLAGSPGTIQSFGDKPSSDDVPLPSESKVKPITQTLVLGSNSLLKMLEEQQQRAAETTAETAREVTASDNENESANEATNQSTSSEKKDKGTNSVDRGSIFRFPSNPEE